MIYIYFPSQIFGRPLADFRETLTHDEIGTMEVLYLLLKSLLYLLLATIGVCLLSKKLRGNKLHLSPICAPKVETFSPVLVCYISVTDQ